MKQSLKLTHKHPKKRKIKTINDKTMMQYIHFKLFKQKSDFGFNIDI